MWINERLNKGAEKITWRRAANVTELRGVAFSTISLAFPCSC
jgi:hypothetical protein